MPESLTFALPNEARPLGKLLAAIPRDFREVNGELTAPRSSVVSKVVSPTCLHIGSTPGQCAMRPLPTGESSTDTAALDLLHKDGPKQPERIRFNFVALGAAGHLAWPDATDYICRLLWWYRNMGYSGSVPFFSLIAGELWRCLFIMQDDWTFKTVPDIRYPPVLRINAPEGDDYFARLIDVCHRLQLREMAIPEPPAS